MRRGRVPAFAVPAGACDCHVHLFGPDRFPYATGRSYTPGPASVDDLAAFQAGLGPERVVVVQPSVYGVDNRCLVDGLERLGARARGVAVIGPETAESDLDRLDRAGIRGVRLNLEAERMFDPEPSWRRLVEAANRVRGRGWHVQVATTLPVVAAIADRVGGLETPVVLDHFAGAGPGARTGQHDFDRLIGLVRSGDVYVKLSGVYRLSHRADYADCDDVARALIEAGPDRMLWGSDWPHTGPRRSSDPEGDVDPFFAIDDALVLSLLARWVPDEAIRRTILVDNPSTLYGFSDRG